MCLKIRSVRETERMTHVWCLAQRLACNLFNHRYSLCSSCHAQNAGCKTTVPLFQRGGPSRAGSGGVAGGTHTLIPTLSFSPGSAGKCCLRLQAVVFWAGPLQASKAQPFLLKGSICSSLALWQRPPTKLNKGSGLASPRSPTISAAFFWRI